MSTTASSQVTSQPWNKRLVTVERIDVSPYMYICIWAWSSTDGRDRNVSFRVYNDSGAGRATQEIELPVDLACKLTAALEIAIESSAVIGEMTADQWARFQAFRAAADATKGGAA